jgi:metallo-beta-lactamase class B
LSARTAAAVALLVLVAAAGARAAPAPGESGGAALAAACAGKDGWSDPAPPARIFGNTYYVGTCGIAALLIVSPRGHVLIDSGPAEAAPLVAANIRRLGFDPRAVRILLSSHAHVDHAGGLSALKRLTGARLLARAEAKAVLESGATDPADPQAGTIPDFAGARVDRTVADGEIVRRGPLALTALATPGHTAGSTSWRWRSCEGRTCRTLVYADSLTAVGPDSYRFSDHPALVAAFRASFARVAALDCGLLVTPHPGASNLFERLAGRAPLTDPGACAAYAAAAGRRLDERLARESAQ